MNRRTAAISISLLLATGRALAGPPSDVLTIGSASALPGATVKVPIYLRDLAGTPLGVDQPAGSRIQGIALKLTYSPASAVTTASVSRAGITTSLTPLFEASPTAPGVVSWVASFSEATQSLPLTLGKPGYGDRIADLTVTLAPGVPLGTKIHFVPTASSTSTGLSNQAGTTLETQTPGLVSAEGMIAVGPYWGDANQDGTVDVFDVTILASYVVGNVVPGNAPFLAPADVMNLDPANGPTIDVFDIVLLAGAIVGNVPTLPVP